MDIAIRIDGERLLKFATAVYVAAGMTEPESRLCADTLVYRKPSGKSLHGRPAKSARARAPFRDTGTGLYIHTQSVDTTTPAGRAMFGMLGIFSEFEREMISKAGHLRKRLGRPGASPNKLAAARRELAKGTGILKTARLTALGTGTVQRLKRETAP